MIRGYGGNNLISPDWGDRERKRTPRGALAPMEVSCAQHTINLENISVEENNKPIKTNKNKKFKDISRKRKYLIEKILKLEQSRIEHKDKNWEEPVIENGNKIIETNVR